MVKIITRESKIAENMTRRIARLEDSNHPLKHEWIDQLKSNKIPDLKMSKEMMESLQDRSGAGVVAEFVGPRAGVFGQNFQTRIRYQVEAGRDMEPLLFEDLYDVTRDGNIQETERLQVISDDDYGVVFTEIKEGEGAKFASIKGSEKVITQRQFAFALEYTKRMFKFNRAFQMSAVERRVGIAANAVQNEVHMRPILDHSYTSRQQTDGTAITKFATTASLVEKYHVTIDEAISHSRTDKTSKRRGPYIILCSIGDLSTVRRAVTNVQQRNFQDISAEVIDSVRAVVAYDGWQGVRGKKTETYTGISSGTAYLVDTSNREFDFISLYSQDLEQEDGMPDKLRFVQEQMIWDMFFGVYAAPSKAVEEITWPVAASGSS